jgi:hypothetical protein
MRTKLPRLSAFAVVASVVVTLFAGMDRGGALPANPAVPNNGAALIFQPPFGWNRVQVTALGLGVWMHPSDVGYHQNISARAELFSGTLPAFVQLTLNGVHTRFPDVKMGGVQSATVCGSHPSTYLTYVAATDGKPLVYEQMLTLYAGNAYVATYTRLATQKSLPEARQALTTLCGGHAPASPSPTPAGPAVRASTTALPALSTSQPMQTYGPAAPTVTPRVGGP